MELKELKNYLKLDDDLQNDDNLILSLKAAAIEYIQNSTGKKYVESDELQNTCVRILIADWYEHRSSNINSQLSTAAPQSAMALIKHIALSDKYEAL